MSLALDQFLDLAQEVRCPIVLGPGGLFHDFPKPAAKRGPRFVLLPKLIPGHRQEGKVGGDRALRRGVELLRCC
jgi:hypothetical protein